MLLGEGCRANEIAEHDSQLAAFGGRSGCAVFVQRAADRQSRDLHRIVRRQSICAQCGDRFQQLATMANRGDAEILKIFHRQTG